MNTIEISGCTYVHPDLPADWRGYAFAAKVNWILAHAAPRPSYGRACAILSKHAAARRRARKAKEARQRQELISRASPSANAGEDDARKGAES